MFREIEANDSLKLEAAELHHVIQKYIILGDVAGTFPVCQYSKVHLQGNQRLYGTDFHSPIFTKELVQYTFIRNSGYMEHIFMVLVS